MIAGTPKALIFSMSVMCLGMFNIHAQNSAGAQENKTTTGKKPMVKVRHATLYKNSHILVYRGNHTIIPKNSIIVLPEHLKSRVLDKPQGEFILWPEFKTTNRDWIWTFEVSLDQAKGITPLPEEKVQDLSKLNRVVVSLYKGNPVSILQDKKLSDKQ